MANPQQELQRARAVLSGGDPQAAARVCQKILMDNPRDLDARYVHGRCQAALGNWSEAAADFRRVLSLRGGYFPAMVDLGIAETLGGNFQDARVVLEQAHAIDSRPAELHFGLGLCRLGTGDNAGAVLAFRDAIERNPAFPDAYNNLGVSYDRLGQLPDAVASFRRAVALHAGYADAHRNLGDVLMRLGDAAAAATALERAAQLQSSDGAVHAELGAAQLAAGGAAAAVISLERALKLEPTLAGAAANLGEALRTLHLDDRAAAAFELALRLNPRLAEAHLGLGKLAAARGDTGVAVHSLGAAADCSGHDPKIEIAAAAELEDLGAAQAALALLQSAARAQPGNAELLDAQGALLHRLGRLPEALDCYERALEIDDRRTQTLLQCGHALESMGAFGRAIASFERLLALRPADPQCIASLASCAFRLCDWDLAERTLSALREQPQGIDQLQSFLMLATDLDPAEVAQSLRRRARATVWPAAPAAPAPTATLRRRRESSPGRLRVAYVSPDFRTHPVAYAIAGMIEHHDRARIVPMGISLSAPDGSAIAGRLAGAFEEFIDASSLGNRDVVKLMREREVDVAIDLAGLTSGARTAIFAMRAAPVQVNYLGFPGSMGMEFMDHIIADRIVLPESDEIHYREKVLRMPHSYLPFDDGRDAPDASGAGGREAAGLPADGFVFCAFNNGYKITRSMFDLWMGLLRDVPGSILWLRSMGPTTAANLKNAAVQFGISAGRLVFAPFEERIDAHLVRLQFADLFLDTLPYNAHTTAAEALWAGVPVVTCLGKAFAGRVGASLLSACGLPELICADLEAYRALALEIARSPALQHRLREQLRQCRSAAPLFDTPRYTRDFEALLFGIEPPRRIV
jgi:predicted O-linked N-acetylglucosamine transferase (SPINDLY family)